MSDQSDNQPEKEESPLWRCPQCDTVVAIDASLCLMCGVTLDEQGPPPIFPEPGVAKPVGLDADAITTDSPPAVTPGSTSVPLPGTVTYELRERQSPIVLVMTAVFAIIILVLGGLVLRFGGGDVSLALVPTTTPVPPTITLTPTFTPMPTETPVPTGTPTQTPIPEPTATLQPPRSHAVAPGETLIGLSLRYRVSTESIAASNGFAPGAPLLVNQVLEIPWPTPTPQLVSVATEINGELVIADPTDCNRYEVQSGDSISAIAGRFDIFLDLFMAVNRLDTESILQPGDTVCIPEIVYGGNLPPTPGPSPTPAPTQPPAGPQLLYPVDGSAIEPPDVLVLLQWVAVKALTEAEWYMVEVDNLSDVDRPPHRGFTRDTSFRLPLSWRPQELATIQFNWRVSIVQVTGWRSDGLPLYTYGGESGEEATFSWQGAVPTASPLPTATATSVPAVTP